MSLENAQAYQNYSAWRTFQVTLGDRESIYDLLLEADREHVVGRPVCRAVLHLAVGQAVWVSSGATHAELEITGPAAAGPGQRVELPIINPHRTVYLRGAGSLTLALYFGG